MWLTNLMNTLFLFPDMWRNISFSHSVFTAQQPLMNSSHSLYIHCLIDTPSSLMFIALEITTILIVLPLCIFTLYHGLQKRWQKRYTSSVSAMSHSDCFTYHLVVIELIGVIGYIGNLAGICGDWIDILLIADIFTCLTWYGQIFFHILMCVDRYMAVVHPVTYLTTRDERGVTIRNICIGIAWLLCFGGMASMKMTNFYYVVDIFLLVLSLTIVCFCSISVLRVLIRPRPGEKGVQQKRIDQSKQRAFYTIVAILGVLVVRFAWNMVWEVLFIFGENSDCVIVATCVWFNLPSSLVLPALYLHRTGKSGCCKHTIH